VREIVLGLRQAGKTYGSGAARVDALFDIDLDVARGELVAIMGRSGSGKSTLLNLAGGLDEPTTGTVLVRGQHLGGLTPKEAAAMRRRHIGFVFQEYNLIPTLTAAENVALPLELDGSRIRAARREAEEALAGVGLDRHADRFPDELSGGEQQRVAIARALVGERSLLLADEPTGALDEVTGESILRLIRKRIDDGAGGVMVTHEPGDAAWADRVITLRDGRIDSVTQRDTGMLEPA
jgi:putative ABC transport system ATP-binding protein